jgi:hypothetical protein
MMGKSKWYLITLVLLNRITKQHTKIKIISYICFVKDSYSMKGIAIYL